MIQKRYTLSFLEKKFLGQQRT